MDIDLATLDGIVKSAGFALPILCLVLWRQDKRLTAEIADRREAWSKNNELLDDIKTLATGSITSIDANTKALEAKSCRYSEKSA